MARSLKMNGISADPITMKPAGKRSAGETILTKADELSMSLQALQNRRRPEQHVEVTFDDEDKASSP